MRLNVLLFLFPLLCSTYAMGQKNAVLVHHNKIDELSNIKEISDFIDFIGQEYFEEYGSPFTINETLDYEYIECQKLRDSLKAKPYYKADIDNNGYTDLLVAGKLYEEHYILTVRDAGNNTFFIKELTRTGSVCSFVEIVTINNTNYLDYHAYKTKKDSLILSYRRLIYKYDDFIEYNPKPKKRSISHISLSQHSSWPDFSRSIYINEDRTITNSLNKSYRMEETEYKELIDLLNYINFTELKERYRINYTDARSGILRIEYGHGKTKTIHDYGLQGTFGLKRVYDIIKKYQD